LARALLPVMRGRPRPWMLESGYASGTAGIIEMELEQPFIIDGEVYEPGPGGRIRLTAPRTVDFVVP
ncbi:MAG TPA: diacylglycerol kinase, partial [Azospirillaceae bacterium]|nr:diacylglycerol kinase [Azospirillaceae bacterium]